MSGTTEAAQKHDINPKKSIADLSYCYAIRTTVCPLLISSRPGELKSEVKLQRNAVNTSIDMQLHARAEAERASAMQEAWRLRMAWWGRRPR